jgi:hypothetical protein
MFEEALEAGFVTVGAAFADSAQTAMMPKAPINFRLVERIAFLLGSRVHNERLPPLAPVAAASPWVLARYRILASDRTAATMAASKFPRDLKMPLLPFGPIVGRRRKSRR